ncbi:MAG: acyl-CoA dehydrogenase family protein [Gemmatimonadaceae bacterium]|jgi:glutaryl-CoA dehydrogenase|nr:acyl-CoA dehydrogenase family protein [Gemmatimonadaceae bacterium]
MATDLLSRIAPGAGDGDMRDDAAALAARLTERPDVLALAEQLMQLDGPALARARRSLQKAKVAPPAAPEIDGDFLQLFRDLTPELEATRLRVREFMGREVEPIANDYWERAEFPYHLIPQFGELGLIDQIYPEQPDGSVRHDSVAEGILTMELARVDCSFATFLGVHAGLAYGSILLCGSPEQQAEWLPKMRRWESLGAFGLTEPDVGSGVAGGIATTCRRDGDAWILSGEKRWIGNSTFGDLVVIWARDVADQQVKGFIVPTTSPGYSVRKMEGKIAQRTLQNGHLVLDKVRVPETQRLQRANGFKDVARVLGMTRVGVAWIAVGCAYGAYERALAYAQKRTQFGRTLGSFQLIQAMLATMVGKLSAMQALALQVSRLQNAGKAQEHHSALAKQYCAKHCREVVALARESMGGNGILLDHSVARFFADAEAIYSYEGSNEINTLIVGRALTGVGAFV